MDKVQLKGSNQYTHFHSIYTPLRPHMQPTLHLQKHPFSHVYIKTYSSFLLGPKPYAVMATSHTKKRYPTNYFTHDQRPQCYLKIEMRYKIIQEEARTHRSSLVEASFSSYRSLWRASCALAIGKSDASLCNKGLDV